MSTRATIAHGEGWHVYHECLEGTVHVELDGPGLDYEVGPGSVCVRLPAEVLAALQGVAEHEPWKMASDEELRRRFGSAVWFHSEEPSE